jgi:predicted metal-dependent hydrolase
LPPIAKCVRRRGKRTTTRKARQPQLDFDRALPHWSWHREFAQAFNAASTTLPHLEPYLNRVVRQAREQLPPAQRELAAATQVFMQQEANHYKLHQRYNETLYRAGYGGLRELEARLHADYERFLATKSLRFNIAYAEGFESLGIIYAAFFFEHIDDLLVGADASVAMLWKWHLAEEFEHRNVCHDLYDVLYGGYWQRIYGLCYAFVHLGVYGRQATNYLLRVDRGAMGFAARLRSRWRNTTYQLRLMAFALPRVIAIAAPHYNPQRRREPRGARALLQRVEAG